MRWIGLIVFCLSCQPDVGPVEQPPIQEEEVPEPAAEPFVGACGGNCLDELDCDGWVCAEGFWLCEPPPGVFCASNADCFGANTCHRWKTGHCLAANFDCPETCPEGQACKFYPFNAGRCSPTCTDDTDCHGLFCEGLSNP